MNTRFLRSQSISKILFLVCTMMEVIFVKTKIFPSLVAELQSIKGLTSLFSMENNKFIRIYLNASAIWNSSYFSIITFPILFCFAINPIIVSCKYHCTSPSFLITLLINLIKKTNANDNFAPIINPIAIFNLLFGVMATSRIRVLPIILHFLKSTPLRILQQTLEITH